MKYGRYEIMDELGKGTMGVVYRAHDPQIDRQVALKVLRPDRVTSEAFVYRFLKEAKAIGRLSHPNIVTVYDVGRDHGTIYIAMEYLEGKPFDEVIRLEKVDTETFIDIGIQVATTLHYAHEKGIVHRDIKPSNLILTQDGKVKLTDFGIAHVEDPAAAQQTQAGEILGTPVYMSPEQVMGKSVDGRSDLYSLGVILYEMATGSRPFSGKNIAAIFHAITQNDPVSPAELDPFLTKELSDLIMKALHRNPTQRFQTGEEFSSALKRCLRETERKNQVPSPERPERNRKPFMVVAAAVLILVLGGLSYLYLIPTPRETTEIWDNAVTNDGVSTGPVSETPGVDNGSAAPSENVAAVVEPAHSLVNISSDPDDAQIYVDNDYKGKTPLALPLPSGKYEVRLTLPGYYEWEAQIVVSAPNDIPPIHRKLYPIE